MGLTDGTSPRLEARIAGALWLIIIIAAAFAEFFVRGRVIVDGNAEATAASILAHESLYRLGGAAVVIYLSCDTTVAIILCELLGPVSRSLSLIAAVFRLAMVAILGTNLVNFFAPLVLLKRTPASTAFTPGQLQALALVSLELYQKVFFVALVFFGFHCLLIGYLVYRSTFLPRIVGALIAVAGLCYLIDGFANVLSPELAARLFSYLLPIGFPGELSLTLWLLAMGVNVQRWHDRAHH